MLYPNDEEKKKLASAKLPSIDSIRSTTRVTPFQAKELGALINNILVPAVLSLGDKESPMELSQEDFADIRMTLLRMQRLGVDLQKPFYATEEVVQKWEREQDHQAVLEHLRVLSRCSPNLEVASDGCVMGPYITRGDDLAQYCSPLRDIFLDACEHTPGRRYVYDYCVGRSR